MRNAFKDGDVWFNTGDVMSPQGMGHAAFADRLGDTFRWKGENVATTDVEAALAADPSVEECTVFGVEVPGTGGRAGMAAVKLRDGAQFDGKALAATLTQAAARLRGAAVHPDRQVAGDHVDVQKPQGRAARSGLRSSEVIADPLYVLAGREEGYVPFYDDTRARSQLAGVHGAEPSAESGPCGHHVSVCRPQAAFGIGDTGRCECDVLRAAGSR